MFCLVAASCLAAASSERITSNNNSQPPNLSASPKSRPKCICDPLVTKKEPQCTCRPTPPPPITTLNDQGKPYYYNSEWYLSADFLWWQGNSGSIKATSSITGSVSSGGTTVSASVDLSLFDFDYQWEPGFRIGVGRYINGLDDWDFFLNWTYYHGHGKSKNFSDVTIPQVLTLAADGTGAWNLNYNVFDLEFGHSFFIKEQVSVRPLLGFRGAILDQKYRNTLGDINLSILGISGGLNAKGKNEFTGAGIRGGARLIWDFTRHFGIIGQFTGSALIGEFNLEASLFTDLELGIAGNGISIVGTSKTEGSRYKVRSNLEGLFGLYTKWGLFHDRHLLEMTLGYEIVVWFHQNELVQFFNANSSTVSSLLGAGLTGVSVPFFGTSDRNLAIRGITFNTRYSF